MKISEEVAEIIGSLGNKEELRSLLLPALHKIQERQGYLKREYLNELARQLDISPSQVYGVATFYSLFKTKPTAEFTIRVCESAPCHIKGMKEIVAALEDYLNIRMGETTPDGKFSLEYTSCLGVCGVAPVIMINDNVHGNLSPKDIPRILASYVGKEEKMDAV